jgi:hypothetical protein
MQAYKEETCSNSKNGKQYKRTKYRCEHDDIWGRLEIPEDIEADQRSDASAMVQ